jgi:hypothetical protein
MLYHSEHFLVVMNNIQLSISICSVMSFFKDPFEMIGNSWLFSSVNLENVGCRQHTRCTYNKGKQIIAHQYM